MEISQFRWKEDSTYCMAGGVCDDVLVVILYAYSHTTYRLLFFQIAKLTHIALNAHLEPLQEGNIRSNSSTLAVQAIHLETLDQDFTYKVK